VRIQSADIELTTVKECTMNWDTIQGNWKQFKGNVKEQWGKLTDDDLDRIAGKRDQLAGRIQEAYGIEKDEVEKQIHEFEKRQKDQF
jgi:uncharacterized protein YjbJ (UPF0337 family)